MKRLNLRRVGFVGFYCCVIAYMQSISAQETQEQGKNIFAYSNESKNQLELQMNTIPHVLVTYSSYQEQGTTIKRLIFKCNYKEENYVTIVIDAFNKSLWAIGASDKSAIEYYPIAQQEPAYFFALLKKYITSTSKQRKDIYYVKTYIHMLALQTIKELDISTELKKQIEDMLQLVTHDFEKAHYFAGKGAFDSLAFNKAQKQSFIDFLNGNKTVQGLLPLFPSDYVKTEVYQSWLRPSFYYINNEASDNYGEERLVFNIECVDDVSKRFIDMTIKRSNDFMQGSKGKTLFYNIMYSNFWSRLFFIDKSEALLKSDYYFNQLLDIRVLRYQTALTSFKEETGIDPQKFSAEEISKLQSSRRLDDEIKRFNQDLRIYYWYLYARKLTLFILQYTLNKVAQHNEYANEKFVLTAELLKYNQALSNLGYQGMFDQHQEEALANFLLGVVHFKQLDAVFNLPDDQHKQAISKSDISNQPKKHHEQIKESEPIRKLDQPEDKYEQVKEPIKQQTKFERLYSLLPNKYVLGGGLATGLLVWYMLRNYAPTLPKLQKYLTPQWFGKK